MTTAVIVIDVQQGLCEGEQVVFEPLLVIERINNVLAKARAAGVLVVWVQHEALDDLVYESREWQLADGLELAAGDVKVRKTTSDTFNKTKLLSVLQQHGVTELVVCGMQTEFCVDSTVRRALALGYPVTLVADAHTTNDKAHLNAQQIIEHHNLTLSSIGSFGVRVRPVVSNEIHF